MPSVAVPKVLLDAGPIAHQSAGLGRYATELAQGVWTTQADRIALRLHYNRHSQHTLPACFDSVPQHSTAMGQYPWRLSVLASQMAGLKLYERMLPATDIYHATEHLLPCLSRRTVLTVHDLIFRHLPETHTWKNRAFLNTAMPIFTRRADAIIAVSAQTKRDLEAMYRVPSEKITVIPEGIDPEVFRPIPADDATIMELKARFGPFLLMVGTLEPRKNHAAALRTLVRLRALGHEPHLVIVGGAGWKFTPVHALVEELNLDAQVTFTGYVPDETLPAYYSGAQALLQPSLYEGFGFPVLESMACGTPVIASDRSSLPELAGDCALLIDPDDVEAFAQAILSLGQNPTLRRGLVEAGLQRARRFTWAETSRRTTDLYLSLLSH